MNNNDFKTIQNSIVNTTKGILGGNYKTGLKLGFEDLDTLLGGLEKGSITVVGGRPSMGKSTFALNVLENVAIKENKTCLFFRLICQYIGSLSDY